MEYCQSFEKNTFGAKENLSSELIFGDKENMKNMAKNVPESEMEYLGVLLNCSIEEQQLN